MTRPLSTLDLAALSYAVEHGVDVFPLRTRDKAPLTPNGFHNATRDPDRVIGQRRGHHNANIGLVPGSMGCVVIDVDGPIAEAKARELGLFDRATLAVKTQRGWHLYFRRPPGVRIGNGSLWKDDGIDIRGDAGYVVVPPSVHPLGHRYAWHYDGQVLAEPDFMRIVDIPTDILAAILAHQDGPDVPLPLLRVMTQETMHALVAAQRRAGRSTDDIADRLDRRVRRYIASVGQRGEGDRNATAYRIARWLLNDFQVSETTAFAYITEWNTRNVPPLSERELAQVIRSAQRSGSRPAGVAHRPRGVA